MTTSLKAQERNPWDYLIEALRAKRLGFTCSFAFATATASICIYSVSVASILKSSNYVTP
ncbi:MAG: hypothetical protein F6K16_40340 [Symploca sp. SIO2B6]|nr:hypothetical protein [Symploca sp. SIO2B6]